MTRYTVWAVFGVDAPGPEQAKRTVEYILEAGRLGEMWIYEKYNVNTAVFVSPKLDKVLGEVKEAT